MLACMSLAVLAAPVPDLEEVWIEVSPHASAPPGTEFAEGVRALANGRRALRVRLSPDRRDALEALGYAVHGIAPPAPPPPAGPSPEEVLDELRAIARLPGVELLQVGLSVQGVPIQAVALGRPVADAAPTWRLLGAHHGDEPLSVELNLAIARELAASSDPEVTTWLAAHTVIVLPLVNPDGLAAGTRANAAGVDVNRNYDVAWRSSAGAAGPRPFSEPETLAVRDLTWVAPPVAGLSFHAGDTNVGYVWNHTLDPAIDTPILVEIATRYATSVDELGFQVTNGAAWYITHGDVNDWSYGRLGILDFTVEIDDEKAPEPVRLAELLEVHVRATLATLTGTPTTTGQVTDARSGDPVAARVRVAGGASGWVATEPASGRFHLVGTDAEPLEIEAPGYRPLQVPPGLRQVVLEPDGIEAPPFCGRVEPGTWLPVPAETVLWRHGAESIGLEPSGQGARIPLDTFVAAGPWSLELPDGTTWRNAVLVDDAPLCCVSVRPEEIVLQGTALVETGSVVWALTGTRRAPMRVPTLDAGAGFLVVARGDLPQQGPIDLIVFSGGHWASVLDVLGDADVDSLLQLDTSNPDPREDGRGVCASVGTPAGLASSTLVMLLGIVFRRRTTCSESARSTPC